MMHPFLYLPRMKGEKKKYIFNRDLVRGCFKYVTNAKKGRRES